MAHQGRRLQTHGYTPGTASTALVLALGACLLGACTNLPLNPSGGGASTPVAVLPDQMQTLHQDEVAYTETVSGCASTPPPAAPALAANQALIGEVHWPSGGVAGQECATTFRLYMAGVHFSLPALAAGPVAHAQLRFRLQVLPSPEGTPTGQANVQPTSCTVDLLVATQDWAQEDAAQSPLDPYAVVLPGQLGAIGTNSPHAVGYDRATQTVTVDVTTAVNAWSAQRQLNQGFLFKSFNECQLTSLSDVALLLSGA